MKQAGRIFFLLCASLALALCGGALLVAISFFREKDLPGGSLGHKIQNDKFVLAGILPISSFPDHA